MQEDTFRIALDAECPGAVFEDSCWDAMYYRLPNGNRVQLSAFDFDLSVTSIREQLRKQLIKQKEVKQC
jgi:hypothetical protein